MNQTEMEKKRGGNEEMRIPCAKWSRKQSCNLSEEGKAPEKMQPLLRRRRKPFSLSARNPSSTPTPFRFASQMPNGKCLFTNHIYQKKIIFFFN